MTRPRVFTRLAIFAALAGLGLYLSCARVTVRNESSTVLTGVAVTGRGFLRNLEELQPGSTHTFWVMPTGETGVELTFRAGGRQIDAGVHGYFQALPHPAWSTLTLVVGRELQTSSHR